MTFSPIPHAWRPATLTLTPGPTGHEGVLTLDGVTVLVRGWHKAASGVVRFECQHEGDGWIERELGR